MESIAGPHKHLKIRALNCFPHHSVLSILYFHVYHISILLPFFYNAYVLLISKSFAFQSYCLGVSLLALVLAVRSISSLPHPDPLVGGLDSRIWIRIRIRPKMSRICNTVSLSLFSSVFNFLLNTFNCSSFFLYNFETLYVSSACGLLPVVTTRGPL